MNKTPYRYSKPTLLRAFFFLMNLIKLDLDRDCKSPQTRLSSGYRNINWE